MTIIYGNYEYEKIETSTGGDDYKRWEYRIKNKNTSNEFKYIIDISKTALSMDVALFSFPITEAITTDGEFLVKKWLDANQEGRVHGHIYSKGYGKMFGLEWKE